MSIVLMPVARRFLGIDSRYIERQIVPQLSFAIEVCCNLLKSAAFLPPILGFFAFWRALLSIYLDRFEKTP